MCPIYSTKILLLWHYPTLYSNTHLLLEATMKYGIHFFIWGKLIKLLLFQSGILSSEN